MNWSILLLLWIVFERAVKIDEGGTQACRVHTAAAREKELHIHLQRSCGLLPSGLRLILDDLKLEFAQIVEGLGQIARPNNITMGITTNGILLRRWRCRRRGGNSEALLMEHLYGGLAVI